jgi:phasin
MNQFTNSMFPNNVFQNNGASFEVPGAFRELAEKGVTQARENYDRFKEVADDTNGAIEAVFSAATKGANAYNAKLVDIAKANTNAMFDLAAALIGATTFNQAAELMTAASRTQIETLTAQSRELAELGQKVATETVEPIKATTAKAFKKVA